MLSFNGPTGEVMGWDDALITIGVAIITSVATDYYMNRPVSVGNMVESLSIALMSMGITNGIGDVFRAGGEIAKALGKAGTIIARARAHGLAQGTLSYVQGGKFWSGAVSAAFASVSGDLLGLAISKTGNMITTIGLVLTATGIGAEIGVPLLAIGNGIRLAGDIAYAASYLPEGNYSKAATSAVETAASYYVSKLTGNSLKMPNATIQNEVEMLGTASANAMASEINGRLVTDFAVPAIKQEAKTNKHKIKIVN